LRVDALQVFHRDVEEALVLAVVVDRAHVAVAHAPGETDLGLEAVGHARVLREVRAQHLDGDDLVQAAVACLVHHAHPALAERVPRIS
jgi:hypothetical protein